MGQGLVQMVVPALALACALLPVWAAVPVGAAWRSRTRRRGESHPRPPLPPPTAPAPAQVPCSFRRVAPAYQPASAQAAPARRSALVRSSRKAPPEALSELPEVSASAATSWGLVRGPLCCRRIADTLRSSPPSPEQEPPQLPQVSKAALPQLTKRQKHSAWAVWRSTSPSRPSEWRPHHKGQFAQHRLPTPSARPMHPKRRDPTPTAGGRRLQEPPQKKQQGQAWLLQRRIPRSQLSPPQPPASQRMRHAERRPLRATSVPPPSQCTRPNCLGGPRRTRQFSGCGNTPRPKSDQREGPSTFGRRQLPSSASRPPCCGHPAPLSQHVPGLAARGWRARPGGQIAGRRAASPKSRRSTRNSSRGHHQQQPCFSASPSATELGTGTPRANPPPRKTAARTMLQHLRIAAGRCQTESPSSKMPLR
mmetsp:Transcript_31213/g.90122  ORF Transcript_31213/g.90122 Transcript_31213/m.90122 type:complete len:422 (-) Transcript_31213:306-1571(-)